jgi:plasmid rolling circle replication initiator protein Rep
LGTIPGQTHRNTTHRTKHRMKNIECSPQLTPWQNQNRDIKKELRSGCDNNIICTMIHSTGDVRGSLVVVNLMNAKIINNLSIIPVWSNTVRSLV